MSIRIILTILIAGLFVFKGCEKPNNFIACFLTEKETYLVDEIITFQNCSTFNEGSENSGVVWNMGDGEVLFSFGNESVTHSYDEAGDYKVKLRIGFKEGPSDAIEKTITIVD